MSGDILKEKIEQIKNIFKYVTIPRLKKIKKRYIALTLSLIIVGILLVNIFSSRAFFNSNASFPIVTSSVGNLYKLNNDYVLLVYIERTAGTKAYDLTNNIPTSGYTYSHYKCENNSTFNYDNATKMTTAQITNKDYCYIYFNKN